MYIYFGIVKKYLPEKGFGFLTHPISLGPDKDIFFHITNIKRFHEDVAERLSTYGGNDTICFWYVSETTRKGEELQSILKPQDVFDLHQDNPSDFKEKIELIWRNIEKPIPFWLSEVTIGLFGSSGKDELKFERETLILTRVEEIEIQRKEEERLRKIEEERAKIEREKRAEEKAKIERERRAKERRRQEEERVKAEEEMRRLLYKQEQQEKIIEEEFELLVAEMESKNFSQSAQVSEYIVQHRLGNKYKNISGILEMSNNFDTWKFKGGFPPIIYARLCKRLNLGHRGSKAKAGKFTPFKDLDY